MFKFWRSGTREQVEQIAEADRNWQFLAADMHAHFLPGLDDGAQNLDQTVALIEEMQRKGFEKMVATPHINEDIYRNNRAIIEKALDTVREEMARREINVEINAAAEYMIDAGFMDILEEGEPLLTIYENKVLVEMSYIQESRYLLDALFRLQAKGYKPILAHPERYVYYHNKMTKYEELKERGCFFQLNAIALSGYYGKEVKKAAEQLLDASMYDYCGSDIHHTKHTQAMTQVIRGPHFNRLVNYSFLNKEILQ